jgi:hypothetical protein
MEHIFYRIIDLFTRFFSFSFKVHLFAVCSKAVLRFPWSLNLLFISDSKTNILPLQLCRSYSMWPLKRIIRSPGSRTGVTNFHWFRGNKQNLVIYSGHLMNISKIKDLNRNNFTTNNFATCFTSKHCLKHCF